MAHVLYGTMLVAPSSVETIQRYLYSPTEIVEAAPVVKYAEDGQRSTGDLVFLILRTEDRDERSTVSSQQQQCDRLASGLHAMTVGFDTREQARLHALNRATDNDWGLHTFAPFLVSGLT